MSELRCRAAPAEPHEDADDKHYGASDGEVETQVQDAVAENQGVMLHDSEDDQESADNGEDQAHDIVPFCL
jgi:hypothetical protein